jgi:hypothetical protein
MKKVRLGKSYDTETATLICCDDFMHNQKSRVCNSLYKTQKGNFFLVKESKYADDDDSLEPIEDNEAKYFYELCQHQLIEYYDAFGVEPEVA